jgi:TRAP-type C4-dicarboxylate transport system permease small subunit
MKFKLIERYLQNRATRRLVLIYAVIMVNIGALMLYNSFSAAELIFDQGFKIGAASLGIGLVALFFVHQHKGES